MELNKKISVLLSEWGWKLDERQKKIIKEEARLRIKKQQKLRYRERFIRLNKQFEKL